MEARQTGQRRRADLVVLVAMAVLSLCMVKITREGERAVVDAAVGRPVLLVGLFGVVLAAVLTASISPLSVWRPTVGALGRRRFAAIVAAWAAVCALFNATLNTESPPVAEEVLGSVFGWLLIEEFVFRGALFDLVDQRWPAGNSWRDPAVLGTAVLFALAHFQYDDFDLGLGWFTVLYAMPTGVLFGYARRRSGSIWPSVALHGVANVVTQIVWVAVQ
ncbi:MAG: CPBP family intramembrane metalloprotease [Acidimicrobiales bacterium]|nr:CPBP family intramembrane metalloprotease [Acidimicrobiales bacterium]